MGVVWSNKFAGSGLSRQPPTPLFDSQVLGLGDWPDNVSFVGSKGVHCEEGSYNYASGALSTFWRSAENFYTTSN